MHNLHTHIHTCWVQYPFTWMLLTEELLATTWWFKNKWSILYISISSSFFFSLFKYSLVTIYIYIYKPIQTRNKSLTNLLLPKLLPKREKKYGYHVVSFCFPYFFPIFIWLNSVSQLHGPHYVISTNLIHSQSFRGSNLNLLLKTKKSQSSTTTHVSSFINSKAISLRNLNNWIIFPVNDQSYIMLVNKI